MRDSVYAIASGSLLGLLLIALMVTSSRYHSTRAIIAPLEKTIAELQDKNNILRGYLILAREEESKCWQLIDWQHLVKHSQNIE